MLTLKRARTGKRGFNLIEAAIVLGVIGLIIGGIWVAAAAVQNNLRISNSSRNLIQIVQNIRNLYYGQSPATATITTTLISAGSIPADMVNGTTIVNAWNGAVTVELATTDTFDVSFDNVPQGACIDLITKNTNLSTGIGLSRIVVTPGTASAVTTTTFPILPSAAVTSCANASDNMIVWRFGLRG